MSWLFSQALVEEYSDGSCSDGEPSVQLSVMPTGREEIFDGKLVGATLWVFYN